MGSYNIIFKPSVDKDLRALPRAAVSRIMKRVRALASDPLAVQATKLSGAERLYRIRVGDYRIVYEVDREARQITVHYVRHRREVYRSL